MPCPKCKGTIGPHSDYCLDCGYDTMEDDPATILFEATFGRVGGWIERALEWAANKVLPR